MSTCHRVVAASVLVLVSAMACDKAPTGANGSGNVVYNVKSTAATVAISYKTSTETVQVKTAPPWSYGFEASPGDFLMVTASNSTSANATVTVEIWRKGLLMKTSTNAGPYAGASASGVY